MHQDLIRSLRLQAGARLQPTDTPGCAIGPSRDRSCAMNAEIAMLCLRWWKTHRNRSTGICFKLLDAAYPGTELSLTIQLKGGFNRQVRVRETNKSEPPFKHRYELKRHQNWGLKTLSRGAWKEPVYGPCGVRCRGGVNLIQA